ncbi:MAG: ABC transporter permease [Gammaproteobacteria bacterium]
MIAALAWRNLWRHSRRTLLNVFSIAFAAVIMVFLLSFQLSTYATMKENVLRIMDGFAQIQPQGYQDEPSLRKTIHKPAEILAHAQRIKGIEAVAPRAMSFVILSSDHKTMGAAVMGVDPEREPRVSTLDRTVKQGRYLQTKDDAVIVLGAALARNLGIGLGDSVTLLGEGRDGSIAADVLKVIGIFETGTPDIDRQFSQIPLRRFQTTFAMGSAVNVIVLSGPTLTGVTNALPAVRAEMANDGAPSQALAVQSWKALQPGLDAAINLDLSTSLLWYASLVIVVVFIILNTLLMSVLERTHEFGVLLAIGMRSGKLGVMIWLELALLALLGLIIGIAIGTGVTLMIGYYGMEMPGAEAIFAQWGLPGKLYPRVSLLSITAGPGVMVLAILLAGIFPYRRLRRIEPVAAMRAA